MKLLLLKDKECKLDVGKFPIDLEVVDFDFSGFPWKGGGIELSALAPTAKKIREEYGYQIDGIICLIRDWKGRGILGRHYGKTLSGYEIGIVKYKVSYWKTLYHEAMHMMDNLIWQEARVSLEDVFNVDDFDNEVVHSPNYKNGDYGVPYKKLLPYLERAVTIRRLKDKVSSLRKQLDILLTDMKTKKDETISLSPQEKLLETAKSCLGVDASPSDVAPDELGCAETVNAIHIKAFGFPVGGDVSTYRLSKALMSSEYFDMVNVPEAGDIVISPTGYGNSAVPNGHVGIVFEDNKIASNDSGLKIKENRGKFLVNYTIDGWRKHYGEKGQYPVWFFRRV